MLDDFVEEKRKGMCGIKGDRYINKGNGYGNGNSNSNGNGDGNVDANANSKNRNMAEHVMMSIWYINANNLYGYAMMQKLPYKDFKYTDTSIDVVLNTPDDSDHGYFIICDNNYTNSCKERTEQLALMPNKRKINDNEVGYGERDGGKSRSEKLILDQNNKTKYMVHYRMLKFYVKMGVTKSN